MKKIALGFFIFVISSITFYYGIRTFVIIRAGQIARELIAENNTPEALTAKIFEEYKNVDNSDNPFLFKWRPYLTNHRLPEWIAFPEGAIETVYSYGFCDNAARKLAFILRQKNIESTQWNMTKPDAAHAVLVATINDKTVLLDPFLGVIGPDPVKAQEQMKKDPAYFPFQYLTKESDPINFYKEFIQVAQGRQGDKIIIETQIDLKDQENKIIGKIDNSSWDVKFDGRAANMTGAWAYLGHKFNRGRIRKFSVSHPARITFILARDFTDNVRNWNITPEIDGNRVVWTLDKDQELVFYDGQAKLSLWHLNSYIPVDQVIIEKI